MCLAGFIEDAIVPSLSMLIGIGLGAFCGDRGGRAAMPLERTLVLTFGRLVLVSTIALTLVATISSFWWVAEKVPDYPRRAASSYALVDFSGTEYLAWRDDQPRHGIEIDQEAWTRLHSQHHHRLDWHCTCVRCSWWSSPLALIRRALGRAFAWAALAPVFIMFTTIPTSIATCYAHRRAKRRRLGSPP